MTRQHANHYPLPRPPGSDSRFTLGLVIDAAAVLESHGYPPIRKSDEVDLQLALFKFLYGTAK